MGFIAMNSANLGLSSAVSDSLNQIDDALDGAFAAAADSGSGASDTSVSDTSSGDSFYTGIGLDTAGSLVSFDTIETAAGESSGAGAAVGLANLTANDGGVASAPSGPPAAPGPAVSLQTLANYLKTGYWSDAEGRPGRFYNMDDNGSGANFGVLYFNVTGFASSKSTIYGVEGADSNGLSAARADMVREAFKIYEEVLGINFIEVSDELSDVDFFFKDNASGAYAASQMVSGSGGAIDHTVININSGWSGGSSVIGDYTFQTILHEIGHALGLGHQGNYNGSGGFSTDALYDNDSWALTMMSYFDQLDNSSSSTSNYDFARLISPMAVDWIALNDLYANMDFVGFSIGIDQAFTGNTVWGFNTNISSTVSAAFANLASLADTNAFTIIDGGGYDTLDFSGFAADQLINLQESGAGSTNATVSNIGGLTGNMTLAVGTIIEAAIGGSGNDTIYGNDVGNVLTGNGGNDIMKGMGGGDVLYGGGGNDTLYGDNGLGGTDIGDSLYGGIGNDSIYMGASGGGDYVQGDAGDDTVYWGPPSPTSARTVYGGDGTDTIDGGGTGFGVVTFNLQAGTYNNGGAFTETWDGFENYTNTGTGATGSEIVIGTSGDNRIEFGSGNNQAYGGGGVDTIYGGAGNDTIEGGFVTDNVYGGDGDDTLRVLAGEFYDNSYGGAGIDTLDHSASNYGGSTFDFELGTITGPGINGTSAVLAGIEVYRDGSGGNTIVSDGNASSYYGGSGDDTMIAEIGGEFMYGGDGIDTINLARWSGTYIVDMATGSSNYGSETFEGFENLISGSGGDTITGTGLGNNISTGGGVDTVYGGAGGDSLFGGADGDTLDGGANDDFLDGGIDGDTIYGGAGGDAVVGGAGSDTGYGGTGNDTMLMDDYTNPGAAGGSDTAYGDANNDLLWGYGGSDTLYGGDDNDSLVGNDYGTAVGGTDSLYGGDGNDQLFVGLGGNAFMAGGAGNDNFFAGTGADIMRGGTGNDYMYGNSGGADVCQFYQADFVNGDVDIVYFIDAVDRLRFSASLNGDLTLTNTSLQYSPGNFVNSVYITVDLGGGQSSAIAVYGTTVAALTPLVEYTL
jgi:Ca2+-binding RTX toxin-like protein